MASSSALVTINNVKYSVGEAYSDTTLNQFLRKTLGLTGTKVLCREGGCGVCVVYVEEPDPNQPGSTIKRSINSCLCPILSCDGWNITTVEGTGNQKKPSQLQQQLTSHNGTQCGYCTPGMVMNMHALTKMSEGQKLTEQTVENSFDGNICRCTGYRPILDAFKTFAHDSKSKLLDLEDVGLSLQICPKNGSPCSGRCHHEHDSITEVLPTHDLGASSSWYRPKSLAELYTLLEGPLKGKKVFLVAGHTSVGVYDDGPCDALVDTKKIVELTQITTDATEGVTVGANVSLTHLIQVLREPAAKNPAQYHYMDVLADHISKVASVPIRNAASWTGNLMLKRAHNEFPSDVFLCFELAEAVITIGNKDGTSSVSPSQLLTTNFDDPKQVILKATFHPKPSNVLYRTYKIMPRSQNSHALVNAGFRAEVDSYQTGKRIIRSIALIFGNINPSFIYAIHTQKFLIEADMADPAVLQGALGRLRNELQPKAYPAEPSLEYRTNLACALFYKFALEILGDVADQRYRSAVGQLVRPLSSGQQDYPTEPKNYPLTLPIPKLESVVQCTGQAKYISDMDSSTMLHAAFVLSEQGSADITQIDSTNALKVNGVVRVITSIDIPGSNNFVAPPGVAEELLASRQVVFAGQPVAIVVATSQVAAENGAKQVKAVYANVKTPILTCQDAIQAKSFYPAIDDLKVGDAEAAIASAPHQVKGSMELGGQMHFYMETQVAVCTPTEDGMDVEAGTQWVDAVQDGVAQVLAMNKSSINVSCKRVGGAYGGKITRNTWIAASAALAAQLTGRQVKMHLSFWDNAKLVGKRNPYHTEYHAGFDADGKLQGVYINAYVDCGAAPNDNPISGLGTWGDNAYFCPNWKFSMTACKTNTPPNTWTRAPGSTEAIYFIEHVMEHIAKFLNKPSIDVKYLNLFKNGDKCITGQTIDNCNLTDLTQQFLKNVEYQKRFNAVQIFNKESRWRKKGISVTPMKYGVVWNSNLYNCFVTIFHNGGAVAVAHGGSEIGQGINTKVAQAVAYELGISMELISIKPNMSLTNANATSTGGSVTSELVTLAALDCCKQLLSRINPTRQAMQGKSWPEVIEKCFTDGMDLTARSWVAPKTDVAPIYYNTWGVTCTEVEIDVLTGEHQILRLDVLHDCGESMSPLIDIGQIEGAVVMGLGYYTSEQLKYDEKSGQLLTYNTWYYKPPTTKDIPADFRVQILKNAPNPVGVLRSKVVAEPPLCMTCSVVFALRNACDAARQEIGKGREWFQLDAPMTVERTQGYCLPDISQYTYGPTKPTKISLRLRLTR
ncbi:hypothetical protein RvY_06020 [Ramazzottius varieornatus]|uniref:FAD-binding PCMH-type domain-containing protein n=1 Tax=Ramazzottius varieornatus TaxID=947166 RepID=A0A1D1V6Q8_RAMVA|nr:hypothetical protein RvY_06020 [Ramazzottius varieornatus]